MSATLIESDYAPIEMSNEALFTALQDFGALTKHIPPEAAGIKVIDDAITMDVPNVGTLTMKVAERVFPEKIVFCSETSSPIAFSVTLFITATDTQACQTKIALEADIPVFVLPMVKPTILKGLNKLNQSIHQVTATIQ
ncbi:hypothetical protein FACS1894201_06570 [Bacteroidia bacterium]|nr:hypothetical protein FACS1894201_06570 [Bacteroidia bacterium]